MLWFYSACTYNYLFRPIPVYHRCVLAIKQIQNKTTYTPQNSNTQTEILYVLKRRFLWWYPPNNNSIQRHQSRCQEINSNFLTIACLTRISQCSSKKKKFLSKFKSHAEVSWQEFCNKLDFKKKEEKEIKFILL